MSQSNISVWLKFALQQMAAESYLDQLIFGRPLQEILLDGNNDTRFAQPEANGNLPGKTRFTNGLLDGFLGTYDIIDHHANDGTGFSATLLFDTQTDSYTLSFRSTESAPITQGGDIERDLFGADLEIGGSGFAFGQLLAMENYYESLKASGKLPAGAVLNVTGFSLGGHLATVFTELHDTEVNHAYIFNSAGRGQVPGEVPGLSAEENRIQDMLAYFQSVLDDPNNASESFTRDFTFDQAAALFEQQGPSWRPFDQGAASLYSDPRYQWAKAATLALFSPTGLVTLRSPGIVEDQGPFAKITQLYGQATTDDLQFIANAGVHAPAIPVFIEGQPLIAGLPFPSLTESGNTHSITLIVDSLATQELIHTIDPLYGQAGAELLIKAASNAKADTVAQLNVADVVEGDSLEKTVDAFRKLFLGTNFNTLQIDSTVGGFGNLGFRNEFYNALSQIRFRVEQQQGQGVVFRIHDLTDPAFDHSSILAVADADTPEGLAYRYTLKELNPFAVVANDVSVSTALYASHQQGGSLDLFDETTGTGTLTIRYLDGRAMFLKEKIAINQLDHQTSDGDIHYKDVTTGYEILTGAVLTTDRQFIFDSDESNTVIGDSAADELFGGGGHDVLFGQGGADYLEGNAGNDILIGGSGDNDVLVGGAGFDTYIYRSGDGTDQIEDKLSQNAILFDQQLLQGGIRQASSSEYTSSDGRFIYAFSGTDLIVNGSLVLNDNFQNGQFGIRLMDLPTYENGLPTRTVFLKTVSNPAPPPSNIEVPFFDMGNNDSRSLSITMDNTTANNFVHALGGNDFIVSGGGNDELYGDENNDEIYGGLGDDRLYGGTGDDQLLGDNVAISTSGGNDYLDGGDGNDFVQGGAGRDIVLGGIGNDILNGDEFAGDNSGAFDDYVDGGADDDFVHGGAGSDVLIGGAGNDQLVGDATQYQNGTPEVAGNDTLDGGLGNDILSGVYGDDVLSGGSGTDLLSGQDGQDVLYGGTEGDLLSGDLRVVSLVPWGGDIISYTFDTNEYRAAGGDDLLYGEDGNDILIGGEGNDTLVGGSGGDTLLGGYDVSKVNASDPLFWTFFTIEGTDWIDAGTGNDVVHGSKGNDTLLGDEGDDGLIGNGGDDVLIGGADNDRLFGDYLPNQYLGSPFWNEIMALGGNNRLEGGAGDDQLWGGDKDDTLIGGDGNDNLQGMYGTDQIFGGEGNDFLKDDQSNYPGTGDGDFLDGGNGDDILEFWEGDNNILHGGAGNDRLTAAAFHGTGTMSGEDGNDVLDSGLIGEATVFSDTIMIGGTGDDWYFVDGVNDVVVEEDGSGIDRISSFIPYVLPDYVENFDQLSGEFVTGNALNNELSANFLDNVIDGRAGADMMRGRFGNDTYIVDNGGDVVSEVDVFFGTDEGGTDTVQSSVTFVLPIYVENLVLTGSQAVDGTGNTASNSLTGNAAENILTGGQGNDTLSGGAGNDTYVFNLGDGVDRIEDFVRIGAGNLIQFGSGITQANLRVGFNQGDLILSVGPNGDTLRLANFDATGVNGSLVVQTLRFADGSTVNLADLLNPPANHAPTVANPLADQIVPEEAPFTVAVPANTFADQDSGDELTFSATLADGDALPTWLNFNPATQTFSGTPDDAQVGSLDLRVTAADTGNLTASDVFSLTVANVNEAPTVAAPIAAQQAIEDTPFTFVLPANAFADQDVVHGDTLTYSATLHGGAALPSWFAFDAATRTFSGTPLNSDVGILTVAVKAMDVGGLSANQTLALTIQNLNDAPTVANQTADKTVLEDAPFSIQVPANTFADPDAGDTLTYNATQADGSALPAWLNFNATTQTFTGTPNDAQVGSLDLRVTATDTGNLPASDVFTLTVQNVNEAPTVASPLPDQQGTQGTVLSLVVPTTTFADVDPGDSLTYIATLANGSALPTWLNFNALTRTFSGTPQAGDVATINVRVIATDTGDLSAADVFVLTIAPSGGTAGNDTLIGTSGNDLLNGLSGNDVLQGLAGNDTLLGGPGNDLLDGGTGADAMTGGTGNDTYVVDNAGDVVTESANEGTDTVQSSLTYTLGVNVENLTLTGTAAINGTGNALNNILTGNSAKNTLSGGAGDDRLDGGAGSDTMIGGTGNDTYVVNQAGDVVTENLNEGIETVESSISYTLGSNLENVTLTGTSNLAATGNALNNTMIGNSGANAMDGGIGNDALEGGAGNDILQGGIGDDMVIGGLGDDILSGGTGNDVLDGGDGTDTLDGSSGDDIVRGGAGNDTLAGSSGADQLTGGTGNDTLAGGPGNDLYTFSRGDGQDTLNDSDALQGNQDRLLFGTTINPLDLVISRQANDLRLTVHGTADAITFKNWYTSAPTNQIEDLQAGNGQHLLNTQVNQLIQAMASFSQQTGLTWDQAIDQQPQAVQNILAASWH